MLEIAHVAFGIGQTFANLAEESSEIISHTNI
jgi:hypothetical protein